MQFLPRAFAQLPVLSGAEGKDPLTEGQPALDRPYPDVARGRAMGQAAGVSGRFPPDIAAISRTVANVVVGSPYQEPK